MVCDKYLRLAADKWGALLPGPHTEEVVDMKTNLSDHEYKLVR